MGMRSAVETPAGVLIAFIRHRRWRQAALARELGVTVETLLRSLRALSEQGMPLIRDDSDAPHIWWRVPKDWAPSGVLFGREQVPSLLRALTRLPRSRERDALLAHASLSVRMPVGTPAPVDAPTLTDIEQTWLAVVEEAVERKMALGMRYFTASRGKIDWRCVSVQRVLVGPPARFVAHCHRSGTLKWFRVENIALARLDAESRYRPADESEIAAFVRESVDGYRSDGQAIECSFIVREPEARWVRMNLLSGMRVDPNDVLHDGVRIRSTTSSVLRVARFVVGLGGAAHAETPELAMGVREIAMGVLDAAGAGSDVEQPRAKRLTLRRAGE